VSRPLPGCEALLPLVRWLLTRVAFTRHQPLSNGAYPTVTNHSGDWSVNPDNNSLVWTIDTIDATENKTGMLEFHSEADDPSQYFPLAVNFVSAESLCEVSVSRSLVSSSTRPLSDAYAGVRALLGCVCHFALVGRRGRVLPGDHCRRRPVRGSVDNDRFICFPYYLV
jgi:hypothetical protein